MRLDFTLMNSMLREIEAVDDLDGMNDEMARTFAFRNGASVNQVAYTVIKMKEAGYITGDIQFVSDQAFWINPGNLTYQGHLYLNNLNNAGEQPL